MEKGYIKLYRSFFDNRMWQAARAFSECEAWLDLIQSARFEATPTTSRIGCYEVTWERGQYPASVRFLSKKWGRPEKWVREFLTRLKKENMITMENTQGVSVITLTNFGKYNVGTPDGTPNYMNNNDLQALTAHIAAQVMENLKKEGHTYGTNNKKEEEYNKETPTNVGAKKDKPSAYENLISWMNENTPTVLKMDNPMTEKQYLKIREKYSYQQLVNILQAMENKKDLRKKYTSAYLTFLQWAKREYGG